MKRIVPPPATMDSKSVEWVALNLWFAQLPFTDFFGETGMRLGFATRPIFKG